MTLTTLFVAVLAAVSVKEIERPVRITRAGGKIGTDIRVTHSPVRRGRLAKGQPPHDEIVNYGLISFLQIAPDRAVALVNRNVWPRNNNWDCEDGSDLFIVGSLDELKTARPIQVGRSGAFPDPARNGTRRWHNRYPFHGGFVPFGAKLNGKPHPHAGTGFLVGTTLTYPLRPDGSFHQAGGDVSDQREFYELTYDGTNLAARSVARYFKEKGHQKVGDTGWQLVAQGFSHAIPDGEDLLAPEKARHEPGGPVGTGICRWSRRDGRWQPVAFTLVAAGIGAGVPYEPSLVRDADGNLLFSARDEGRPDPSNPKKRHTYQDLNAWLSKDGGRTWEKIMALPTFRAWAPLSVGATASGRTFIATDPAIEGRNHWYWTGRTRLSLWPFDRDYRALGDEIVIRDTEKELPAAGRQLLVDHPYFTRLRLADGRWHGVVSYRVRLQLQTDDKGNPLEPGPDDGAYAEEITADGEPQPLWEF